MNLPYETTRKLNALIFRKFDDVGLDASKWKEYLVGLGCAVHVFGHGIRHMAPPPNPIEGTVMLYDPADFTCGVAVPDDLALKVLTLGGFP